MPPITWQNVTGRSLSEAAAPLEAAQKAMTAGFNNITGILKTKSDLQDSNIAANRVYNTSQLLNEQLGMTLPQLEEQQANNTLGKRLDVLGAQVDADKIRAATDPRIGELRLREKARIDQEQATRLEQEKPLEGQLYSQYSSGDYTGARKQVEQSNLFNKRSLLDWMDAQDQQRAEAQQRKDNYQLALRSQHNSDISTRASVAASNESMLTNRTQRALFTKAAEEQKKLDTFAAIGEAASREYDKNTALFEATQTAYLQKFKLPVTAAGSFDSVKATPEQRKTFATLQVANPAVFTNANTSSSSASKLTKTLKDAGISASQLGILSANYDLWFNGPNVGVVGNDRRRAEEKTNAAQAFYDDKISGNPYAASLIKAPTMRDYAEAITVSAERGNKGKSVPLELSTNPASDILKEASDILRQGIVVPDPDNPNDPSKSLTYPIPIAVVEEALAATEGSYRDVSFANKLRQLVQDLPYNENFINMQSARSAMSQIKDKETMDKIRALSDAANKSAIAAKTKR